MTDMQRIALDVHAHLAPVYPDDLAAIAGVSWDASKEVLSVDGHPIGIKALYKPAELIAWMDANRVERTWISIPPPLYRPHLRGNEARAWCDYANRGLVRIAQSHSGRLETLPHLPIGAPDVATEIAREWTARGHARFGATTTGDRDQVLSDPVYEDLWRALDEAKAFVFFHPGECADGRLTAFYLSNLVGNPYETTVAISHIVLGGVIERFPRIVFCFAHGGGTAPMLAGRLIRGFETQRPGIETSRQSPRQLLKHICVDCITHDVHALELAENVFGETQVLFGSDWPFPMGLVRPHEQMADVPTSRRQRIFCDNPAKLLNGHR